MGTSPVDDPVSSGSGQGASPLAFPGVPGRHTTKVRMVNTLVGMTPTDRKGWCGHIGHCVCCEHTCGRTGEWTGLVGRRAGPASCSADLSQRWSP